MDFRGSLMIETNVRREEASDADVEDRRKKIS